MILDQLFENNKNKLNEIDPRNYDSDEDYYNDLYGDEGDEDVDPPEDDWYDDADEPESHYEKSLRVRGLGEESPLDRTRDKLGAQGYIGTQQDRLRNQERNQEYSDRLHQARMDQQDRHRDIDNAYTQSRIDSWNNFNNRYSGDAGEERARRSRNDDDWQDTFDMMRDRINRYQYGTQRDVDPEQLAAISNITYTPRRERNKDKDVKESNSIAPMSEFYAGDEVMWRPRNAKMAPVPVTVVAVAPGKLKIKLQSPRMIQNYGKDTIVINLATSDVMLKQGVAEAKASTASFRASNKKRAELNSMTPEQRKAYDKEQQEKQRKRDDARLEKERQKLAAKKGVSESEQLDELNWKDIQRGANKVGKSAQKFTKNVADTGAAIGGAASNVGGAIKQVGKTAIADPVSATYNAAKSGLNKAAGVATNTYNDVKSGVQKVGQAGATVGTDLGNAAKSVGRGVANVAGGTAGALGSVAGGATTGVGRAAAKGFNTGVQNVGGDAVDRLQTNIMTRKPEVIKQEIADMTAEIEKLNTELAQSTAPKYNKVGSMSGSINNATGKPYTQDELEDMRKAQVNATQAADAIKKIGSQAKTTAASPNLGGMLPTATPAGTAPQVSYGQGFNKPAAAAPATPNFARTGFSGYSQATPAPKAPAAPTVPAAPRVTTGGPTKAEKDRLAQLTAAAAARQPVAETIKQVVSMMETVTTKSDVQRVKNYIDFHFGKDLTESTRITRNKLIGEVTQLAAIRRRKIAANLVD